MRYRTITQVVVLACSLATALVADNPAAAPAGPNEFLTGKLTSISPSAVAMASGDFNHDGKLDLAVADVDAQTVTILFGRGNGSFTAGKPIPATTPGSVTAADLNGDGNLDLVLVAYNYNELNILLGNGKGGFKAAPNILIDFGNGVSGGCLNAAVRDFNGDGKLDIAVACTAGVAILLGNGDGTFGPNPTILPTGEPYLVVADVNGDGKPDLLGAGPNINGQCNASVDVFLGNGDGTFQPVKQYSPNNGSVCSLTVADFNGDGILDVAVTTLNSVGFFPGNGDGTFGPMQTIDTSGWNGSVLVPGAPDFNGDGKKDLAVVTGGAGGSAGGCVVVYMSNGKWHISAGCVLRGGNGFICRRGWRLQR